MFIPGSRSKCRARLICFIEGLFLCPGLLSSPRPRRRAIISFPFPPPIFSTSKLQHQSIPTISSLRTLCSIRTFVEVKLFRRPACGTQESAFCTPCTSQRWPSRPSDGAWTKQYLWLPEDAWARQFLCHGLHCKNLFCWDQHAQYTPFNVSKFETLSPNSKVEMNHDMNKPDTRPLQKEKEPAFNTYVT